jgi:hypothetical protein
VAGSGQLDLPAVEVIAPGERKEVFGRCFLSQAITRPGAEADGGVRHAFVIFGRRGATGRVSSFTPPVYAASTGHI